MKLLLIIISLVFGMSAVAEKMDSPQRRNDQNRQANTRGVNHVAEQQGPTLSSEHPESEIGLWKFLNETAKSDCGSGQKCTRHIQNISCSKDPEPVCAYDDEEGNRKSVVGEKALVLIKWITARKGSFTPRCEQGGICEYPALTKIDCAVTPQGASLKNKLACNIHTPVQGPVRPGELLKERVELGGDTKTSP